MLISKTPYRFSFFGGGTDFTEYFNHYKTKVIGTTIDKYIYITKNYYKPTDSINIKLFYKRVELIKNVNEIKHSVIKKLLQKNKYREFELHFISDLPSYSGLGSSSSFSTGLINLLNYLDKKKISKRELAKFVINFERKELKESVGYQDQIFSTHGGFNIIKFYKNEFSVENMPINNDLKVIEDNSFIIHTKLKRRANDIEKKKLKKFKKNLKNLKEISDISNEAYGYLKKGILNKNFSYLMKASWSLKKSLHKKVSNFEIEELYENGLKNGAECGKILGAGNGGFMYFFVPKERQKRFLMKFKNAIKINFCKKGTSILKI